VAIRADIVDELDVNRLFAETIAAFGGIDVVVHAAGSPPSASSRSMPRSRRPSCR
jgi:NAD(P)-dependent dehydrogenase (short-subunit alcohol dehydrogenase family)